MADDIVTSILEDLDEVADRPLTPEDVQALKDAVFADPGAFEGTSPANARTSSSGATKPRRHADFVRSRRYSRIAVRETMPS